MPQSDAIPVIAGDAAVLARRYAGALYSLALDQKTLDPVAEDLRALQKLIRESADFRAFASNPRLSRPSQVKAVQAIAADAKLNRLTGNFLALLAQNRRLDLLDAVINAYLQELAARRGEFTAEVRSAEALSPEQEEQLAVRLRDLAGGKVSFTVTQDKSLLGGLVVRLGSKLIDASVKSRLARLERQLKSRDFDQQAGAA